MNEYVIFVWISALLSSTAALYTWRRRRAVGATALALLFMATTIWSFGYAMELSNTEKNAMYFWLRIEYLGISFMSLWCLLFALQYTGQDKWITRRHIAVLSVIPGMTLLLQWTNPWHGLFYSNVEVTQSEGMTVLALTKGMWYWVHIANFYLSFLVMVFLILRMYWRRGPLYRNQVLTIVIGALPPCIGNVLYLTDWSPFPNLDLSPFAFALMGIAMLWGLFHYRLFNVVPVARDALIESMNDGVLVLDTANRVVDINAAAKRLISLEAPSPIGQKVEMLLPKWPEYLTRYLAEKQEHQEIALGENASQYLDLRMIQLIDRQGRERGLLITLRDITPRKQMETERENLIRELQEALARVQTLNGLLPICANCKKIRDDQGYWHQVEVYIREHSGADFSHGICPECAQKLYPEYQTKKTRGKE